MSHTPTHFHPLARTLHWAMAVLIIAMLFIGVGMVASISPRHAWLIALHKPLGILLLILALLRLLVRVTQPIPSLPKDLPRWQQGAASLSHYLLYALMVAQPLVGWGMLSAGGYPVTLAAGLQLPPLLAPDIQTYALLRTAHTWLAYLFFATILLHAAAALFHGLIRRDGVLASMTGQRH